MAIARDSSMECRELIEMLTERYEETLLAQNRSWIQRHLDHCPRCRAKLARRRQASLRPFPCDPTSVTASREFPLQTT